MTNCKNAKICLWRNNYTISQFHKFNLIFKSFNLQLKKTCLHAIPFIFSVRT